MTYLFHFPVVSEPRFVILGAGHVGKALSSVARFSGFRVEVSDNREEYANRKNIPHARDLAILPQASLPGLI